ncbi:hypothetical protein BJ085DRAFT_19320 [Dimargaris cristalligena]|uniref:Uncharacterized protein n=1 Tax=Dimargaris cristalligena TaxID=215637 RepID=A0A4P9ZZI4_9FUNG|nr:hypothetical protein BJ085DRAFT_19320 [Dimargaris cristalligena]|eukprot:RKP39194.1 hypothetical protein BJ085DRAFT_19320 [Dimargaris cristalligena]
MSKSKPILVYHAVFAFAVVYSVVSWWDALVQQNIFQVFSLVAFNLMLIMYSVIQSFQHSHLSMTDMDHIMNDHGVGYVYNTREFELGLTAMVSFCSFCLLVLAYPLYRSFAWGFYQRLGADVRIRSMNVHHLVLIMLLKLDFFFFTSYAIQMVTLLLTFDSTGTILRVALGLPLSILVILLGYFGVNRENRAVTYAYLTGLVIGLAYIVFELAYMIHSEEHADDPYVNSRKFLYFFSVILILLIIASFSYGVLCLRNFNRGLKEARAESSQEFESLPTSKRWTGRPTSAQAAMRPISNVEID